MLRMSWVRKMASVLTSALYNVYGVPEKVKRQKWIEGTYVNQKFGETDVIIHKVKN